MAVRKKLLFLLVIEIILIGLIIVRDHDNYRIELVESLSNNMEQLGEGFHIKEEFLPVQEKKPIMIWNFGTLQPGTYKGYAYYKTDNYEKQSLHFSGSNLEYIKANDIVLDHRLDSESFVVTLTNPVDDFSIILLYQGEKDISIEVQLYRSRMGMIRNCSSILIIFTILELAVVCFYKRPEYKQTILILLIFSFISFLPYLLKGIYPGHDFYYHFLRIESIAEGLRNRQFPVYLSPLFIGNYGYPAALYYCDLFLYIPAFFRILGFSFDAAFKIFIYIFNLFSVVFAYISFRDIFRKKDLSFLLTFVYTCAPYRLGDLYIRSAVGEYCAITFLPLVVAGFHGICFTEPYNIEEKRKNPYRKYILFLTIGMSGIILTHLLTTEITILILLILCIILWKRMFNLQRIRAVFHSFFHCLLICLFFVVPFLDFYINNDIEIKHKVETVIPSIQSGGIQVGEFFLFFKNIDGPNGAILILGNRLRLSLGFVLMTSLLFCLYFVLKNNSTRKMKLYTGITYLCLFLASDLFPWDQFAYYTKVGAIISQIQFSWRFLTLAIVFATLSLGELLCNHYDHISGILPHQWKNILFLIGFFVFIDTNIYASNYMTEKTRIQYFNTYDINVGDVIAYHVVRNDAILDDLVYTIHTENALAHTIQRRGFHWDIYCETFETPGYVAMPLMNYQGYRVTDEFGNSYKIEDGLNKNLSFILPEHFQGMITVKFQGMWYWYAAIVVSSVYLFGWAIVLIAMRKKNRSNSCLE